jgi:hypothetical protein
VPPPFSVESTRHSLGNPLIICDLFINVLKHPSTDQHIEMNTTDQNIKNGMGEKADKNHHALIKPAM